MKQSLTLSGRKYATPNLHAEIKSKNTGGKDSGI